MRTFHFWVLVISFALPYAVHCQTTHKDSLGISKNYPIKVGAGVYGGPGTEIIYLRQLVDIKGRDLRFRRLGSCCHYPSKDAPLGMGTLDVYRAYLFNGKTIEDSVDLYLTYYDYNKPGYAPKGFRFRTEHTADSIEVNRANVLRRFGKDTILSMSFDKLTEVPPYVFELSHIRQFRLGWNNLTSLPKQMGTFKSLRVLELQNNPLRTLPAEIAELDSLEEIYLPGNMDWEQVFTVLAGCERLRMVDWVQQSLTSVPEAITKSNTIRQLNIRGNKLDYERSFKVMAKMKNLRELTIGDDSDKTFKGIEKLQQLRILNIEFSKMIHLSPEIAKLKDLEELHFRYCRDIRKLPVQIKQMQNLIKLSLYSMDEKFDYEGGLSLFANNDLKYIDISQAWRLKRIPPAIFNFTNLEDLGLNIYETDSIAPEIGKLVNLKKLDLSASNFKYIPPEFGKMRSLLLIDLTGRIDFNYEELFDVLANLENLEELYISIEDQQLPDSIARLKKIKRIVLTDARVKPEELERLQRLLPGCTFANQ